MQPVDLRSDTLTKPTDAMRQAMAHAEVGDDVFGTDPTVKALEAKMAEFTGKEAALFVPSGTMANQLALMTQTRPGDEIVCSAGAHLAWYECGAAAALCGVQCTFAHGDALFDRQALAEAIKQENAYETPTSLVAVENTHNRAGGAIWPMERLVEVSELCRERGLPLHMDGARLWNASVARGISVRQWAEQVTSLSMCFSKGLGAPAGSALMGSQEMINRARVLRKRLGGTMRQVGILAAGALHGVEQHVERLADDHKNAERFSAALRSMLGVAVIPPQTNLVVVRFRNLSSAEAVERLAKAGVLVGALDATSIRAAFHLDVSEEATDRAIDAFYELLRF